MAEVVALLVLGASVGALISYAFSWDHGFKSGVSWANRHTYRQSHD